MIFSGIFRWLNWEFANYSLREWINFSVPAKGDRVEIFDDII
jgi:hypothetical protein